MFQFPGFAFINLCIQSINTWFSSLLAADPTTLKLWLSNNNKLSGGLPHSEIAGSKPILGSPTLIAEYHVLHRLLLPRHPPNALFALDLIQKKLGFPCAVTVFCNRPGINQKQFTIPPLRWFTEGHSMVQLPCRI
jgi:hypothetical protein